jgi:PleD family two-component response regulator
VSIGIYEIQPDDTLESVLQKADSALYKAKQDGKNKIIVFKEQLNQQLKI